MNRYTNSSSIKLKKKNTHKYNHSDIGQELTGVGQKEWPNRKWRETAKQEFVIAGGRSPTFSAFRCNMLYRKT